MTEEKADSGPVEEPSEPGEPSGAEAKGAAAPEAAPKSRKDIDPDAELQYTDLPAASLDELRAALDWAFEGEAAEPELLDRFARHAELVLQGNQRMNLTAIVDPKEVAHAAADEVGLEVVPLQARDDAQRVLVEARARDGLRGRARAPLGLLGVVGVLVRFLLLERRKGRRALGMGGRLLAVRDRSASPLGIVGRHLGPRESTVAPGQAHGCDRGPRGPLPRPVALEYPARSRGGQ
jgi:hypothetical protein